MRYRINLGANPKSVPELGELQNRTEPRLDANGRDLLPGAYRVVSVTRELSTTMDDGSREVLVSYELEEA
jgi:hypothetical protein